MASAASVANGSERGYRQACLVIYPTWIHGVILDSFWVRDANIPWRRHLRAMFDLSPHRVMPPRDVRMVTIEVRLWCELVTMPRDCAICAVDDASSMKALRTAA